uniref:Gag protein n=1 Tax=Onchocerca volvulus TaxID=6282 RepID=A0A8R1TN37_ONCVO
MSSSTVASIQPAKTRVQLCVKPLKEAYDTWLSYIQTITTTKKRDEEEKIFESVLEGEQGLFRILHEGQEAIITLTRHKNESEQKLEKLLKGVKKEQKEITFPPNQTVQRPQLPLPTFNGDPRQWRQFWSSFDAAVHSQAIPDIQKLNYLYSSLRGKALQAVSGYEIAPENYSIIRRLLKNKYGDPSIISSRLYKEL